MASWLDKTGLTYFWGKIKSAILKNGIEYINGTQTGATGSWTGVTKDASLYTGKTIAYRLPYAGSGNASLNLTLSGGGTTGAKEVYLNTTRATTHFGAGAVITMTYDGTRWRADSIPNTNNIDRRLHNQYVLAAANIPQYRVCVGTSAGYKPIAASVQFDLSYPILYCASANQSGQTYAVASGQQSANMYEAIPSINLANNGTVEGIAKNKTVFLKGTISGNTFTLAASNFMTCTVPSSADNFYYIPIALVGNDWSTSATTKYFFAPRSEIYAYEHGSFGRVPKERNCYGNVLVSTPDGSTLLAADTGYDCIAFEAGSGIILGVQNYTGQGDPSTSQGHTGPNIDKITIRAKCDTAANIVSTLGNTAVNRATADANGNDIASTYAAKSHTHGSITAADTRSAENPPTWGSKEVKPFFTNQNLPSGITTWASGLHVNGWTGDYNAWEIVGPSSNSDQRTQPFYVRVGRTTNGWGSWRQLYDSSNPQTTINGHSVNADVPSNAVFTDTTALGSMTGTLGVGHGGTGVATLGAGVVYHSASGTGALSIATAANLVSALGTTAVNRATADASGNNIANTYYKKSELGSMFYGTCSTAAATQAKVVTCSTFTSANLVAGCSIKVKFTNAQTYNGAPTLNINSTGAKTVKMIGTTNPPQYWWQAGEMVTFVYDGTNWLTTKGGYATTTYYGQTKLSDAINSTSTTLAATANAARKAYNRASEVIATETGTLTLLNTNGGGSFEVYSGVWKSGNVVTISFGYVSTTAQAHNSSQALASIPTAWAPSTDRRFPVFTTATWSSWDAGYAIVNANGNIYVTVKTTSVIFGTFTYVI